MARKTDLNAAKKNKADEFYTQIEDIFKEVNHYREHFRGKVVFCNCDDPYESNFFKYFAMNFNFLGLKQLIATCYVESPIVATQLSLFDVSYLAPPSETGKEPHKIIINEVDDYNADGAVDLCDVEWLIKNKKNTLTRLAGNGDFRSDECVELLRQADIVVTNPPFSLFRAYVAQLMQYKKQFLIIGNVNAITYKEIFPLIASNQLWLGVSIHSGDREFRVPDSYPLEAAGFRVDEDGHKYIRVKGVRWFTNLDHQQRHEELPLGCRFKHGHYPKYDNYDAINVDKTSEIPCDYDGTMGVPITYLDKYNPDQFELLGLDRYIEGNKTPNKRFMIDDNEIYARIVIRHKQIAYGQLVEE